MTHQIIIENVKPVYDVVMRRLCTRKYEGHPHGCPNWNSKVLCPPKAPGLTKVIDLERPVYAVASAFNLAAHVERMREKHPDWSDRQLHNCLYWQGTARKRLRGGIDTLLSHHPDLLILVCPEACGLIVGPTVEPIGVKLEWPPKKWDWHVALAGHPQPDLKDRYPSFASAIQWGSKA